jgi:hypothetical protein
MTTINKDDVGRIVSIRYRGRLYDHYGILDGRGNLIHVHKKKGQITSDPLGMCLKNATKVEYLDDDFDTRWYQYQYASSLIGSTHNYKFFTDNCESWVQKIRTGHAFSRQVENLTNSLSTIILGIGILFGSME